LDEVQSGFEEAESFAHQFHNIKPDIICMAKRNGERISIGGIHCCSHFEASLFMVSFGLCRKYRH
jgi:acetylornithine aminotransferase